MSNLWRAAGLLVAAALLSATVAGAQPQPSKLLPEPPLWPGFGAMCDGGPVWCTRIDEFLFNARADLLLLPNTDQRGFTGVMPYGFSFSVLKRLEFGMQSAG